MDRVREQPADPREVRPRPQLVLDRGAHLPTSEIVTAWRAELQGPQRPLLSLASCDMLWGSAGTATTRNLEEGRNDHRGGPAPPRRRLRDRPRRAARRAHA